MNRPIMRSYAAQFWSASKWGNKKGYGEFVIRNIVKSCQQPAESKTTVQLPALLRNRSQQNEGVEMATGETQKGVPSKENTKLKTAPPHRLHL